jgi:signal transduction histidine kinase/ActR/RegA family two-component response regulator
MGERDWGISSVLRSGKPELYRSLPVEAMRARAGEGFGALFADTDIASTIVVPISARGRTLGAIVLTSICRSYDDEDVAILGELGRRAGLALDNARLYREAREGERQKDEFLAMLSHELRNPLAPIVGALDLMKVPRDGAFAKERAVIDRHVRHIVRLVDDLLDVARITRGKIELRKEAFEISHVVTKAVEMVAGLVDERGQRLTVSVPEQGARVLADEARLTQAIANLLSNATKFTGAGGEIRVTGEVAGDEVVIRVKDSGIGIAPDALERIFGLFVQEKPALDRGLGGLGIGLTVVKQLVALHGGSASATSGGLGHGSEFAVRLPLVRYEPTGDADEDAAFQPPAAPGAARVLVVDDNVDAADMVAAVIAAGGYTVRVAYDGPSALAVAAEFEPNIAVVDIGLPGMTGYELAAHLHALPCGASMRLIALTGYGQSSDAERSRGAGFEMHLVKPVDFDALEKVLEGRPRRTTR